MRAGITGGFVTCFLKDGSQKIKATSFAIGASNVNGWKIKLRMGSSFGKVPRYCLNRPYRLLRQCAETSAVANTENQAFLGRSSFTNSIRSKNSLKRSWGTETQIRANWLARSFCVRVKNSKPTDAIRC